MPPSKNSKSQEQELTFFPNIFNKMTIFPKSTDTFSDSGGSSRHFDYLFTCLGLIVKLLINYLQHHVEFTKNYENHVNFKC